jgi:acetamidase/formamidase
MIEQKTSSGPGFSARTARTNQEVAKEIRREEAPLTEFGAHLEPKLRVEPGERFLVETQDAFFGQIKTEEDLPTSKNLPPGHRFVNPVAGPIYVEGLKAGDLLVLEIEDIIPSERGWTGFGTTLSNLAKNTDFPELQRSYSRITHHQPGPSGTTSDGTGTFSVNREVSYPLRPFLGTIVTAPERGVENTLVTQGPWGGNIDCHDVRRGNKIMLNTYHDGGLLFFGDAHAAQADSEYTAIADETAADVLARCQVVERKRIPGVLRIETPKSLIQVDSARNAGSIERALNGAFIGMMRWLTEEYGMDTKEAYLHFSVNPDVRINTYQFIGPVGAYAVGVQFPKEYL